MSLLTLIIPFISSFVHPLLLNIVLWWLAKLLSIPAAPVRSWMLDLERDYTELTLFHKFSNFNAGNIILK